MNESNEKRNPFKAFAAGLARTRETMFGKIATALGMTQIDDDAWDELESLMIQADIGSESAEDVIRNLQGLVEQQGLTRKQQLQDALKSELIKLLSAPPAMTFPGQPTVLMMVGVNGSGKTTTTAKLAKHFRQVYGMRPILAACDTFRAAAVEQLQTWGQRVGVDVIAGAPNADPSAVLFDALQASKNRNANLVIADTAGRLHTKFNLMEELRKVWRVAGRTVPGAPHHAWLVLDGTTGQNALNQAKAFRDVAQISGVIVTKLDGTAKGGMVFAIERELDLPIYFLGLGEKVDDLLPFSPEAFVQGLLQG
jgi:fused signal recognition particle receptor